jgi:hypothetical protein
LRPARCGLCRYESLRDGTLDLVDIAIMNDELDVAAINQWRVAQAIEARQKG